MEVWAGGKRSERQYGGSKESCYRKKRQTSIKNPSHRDRFVGATGESAGGGMGWEVGISRHKLVCIKWINSEVLL